MLARYLMVHAVSSSYDHSVISPWLTVPEGFWCWIVWYCQCAGGEALLVLELLALA